MTGAALDGLVDAAQSFADRVGAIAWTAVALALLCHFAKVLARTRAWRNILAASYPETTVRWRDTLAAYVAGTGVNAILPARSGDALKLLVVHRRVDGATYPTLAATLLVETLFDAVVASALLVWALQAGFLPGLDVLPTLPSIDWLWLFQHPRVGAAVGIALLVVLVVGGALAARRIARFRERVKLGFAVLSPPGRYVRRVVPWQALSWVFRVLSALFFLRAFGIGSGVENALRVQVTESLSTVVPLTPGGIGTEQALLVYVLRGEAPVADLLSFSVGMKVVLVVANVAAGALALALTVRTLRWRRLVAREPAPSAPEV